MKQEVKDFLSKAEIKLVEPYIAKCSESYNLLVIAESIAIENNVETVLCIDSECSPIWFSKKNLIITKPKSRSIEDGLVGGDILRGPYGDRKVLMANQYCVLLSSANFDKTGGMFTYSELVEKCYTLKQ